FQDPQTLRVRGHDAVFNSVVNHFYEMSATVRAAVQISLLRRPSHFFASWSARNISDAGSQACEDRIEVLHDLLLSSNHHAVAAFEPPHATAGTHIDVVDLPGRQFLGAANVIHVVGVAAVDEDVLCFK